MKLIDSPTDLNIPKHIPTDDIVSDVSSVSCAREYMWLNMTFILIQSNLAYSSNAIALNLENQSIKTSEYCNISLSFFIKQ